MLQILNFASFSSRLAPLAVSRFAHFRFRQCIALAGLAFAIVGPQSALAVDRTPRTAVTIESVEIGFRGVYKVGRWTELVATVKTTAPLKVRLVVDVLDPDGSLTSLPGPIEELTSTHRLHAVFKSGRLDSGIGLRVVDASAGGDAVSIAHVLATRRLAVGDSAESELRPALRQSATVWATLGDPSGFGDSTTDAGNLGEKSDHASAADSSDIHVARLANSSELPIEAAGYDGLDALIIASDYTLSEDRNAALREWVRLGGHLLLSVGSRLDAYESSPLAKWIGESISARAATIGDWSSLESFSGGSQSIVSGGRVDGVVLTPREGDTMVAGLDGPMLVRVPFGFGRITFLGLDLDRPPLAKWESVHMLCRKILIDRPVNVGGGKTRNDKSRLSHSGITEFASQMQAILEDFPSVRRSSSWTVMGLMLLYLLMIGPVDYLLVHRLLKKPRLTWLTFPAMVLLASGMAIATASSSNGKTLQLNQFEVIDVDAQTGLVRSNCWATAYSPDNRRYRVAVQPLNPEWSGTPVGESSSQSSTDHQTAASATLSWNGIPEDVFGGMYRASGVAMVRPGYQFTERGGAVENLPIGIWSTKTVTASWNYRSRPLIESALTSSRAGQLTGSFSHHLPVPVQDWVVAYGNRVYRPRREQDRVLKPDAVWDPNSPIVFQRELKGYLTRMTATRVDRPNRIGGDILIEQSDYDPMSLEPADFMRMLTFHDAAGGPFYTKLENNALSQLDLSSMLHLDRAVLFGSIDVPASDVQIDGQSVQPTRHIGFIRFLLPVDRKEVVRRELPNFE